MTSDRDRDAPTDPPRRPWHGMDRRQLLFAALDLLTSVSFLVNTAIADEGLSQELQPRLDELRALIVAEVALINHLQDKPRDPP